MGAAVSMEDLPPNAAQEAAIAMAGPIVGSMAACVPMWYIKLRDQKNRESSFLNFLGGILSSFLFVYLQW